MHQSRKLDLVSMYLTQPVLGARVIGLQLGEHAPGHFKGQARMDPNTCSLNPWGDRGACTKIAVHTRDVEAIMTRTMDPLGHKRIHYSMNIEGVSDARVHLIEYPKANLWYLTVVSEKDGTAVVPLFEAEWFAFDAVGTVQVRYGVPLRDVMSRGDVNEMRAEAEAVRRALAELDAEPAERSRVRSLEPGHVADVRAALAELEGALRKLEG